MKRTANALRRVVAGIAATFVLAVAARAAASGEAPPPRGGNERVVVIANAASPLSITLARHYVQLRQIPPEHLLVLEEVPGRGPASAEPITLDECRTKLLQPVMNWLADERLTDEIDAILWSSGFPHAVDVAPVVAERKLGQVITGVAALTGLTYFAREVVAGDLSCLALSCNGYCKSSRGPDVSDHERQATDSETELWATAQKALQAKDYVTGEKVLRELATSYAESASVWYDLACCEALNGKKKEALQSLRKAVDAGYWNADHAQGDADLVSVREDATFAGLLEKMRKHAPHSQPSAGFGCDRQGRGKHYLSTFLAWLGPFGNTWEEAVAGLERSAAADGTNPRGTFYFLKNGDVRATTRAPLFVPAMEELVARGRSVALLEAGRDGEDGLLPKKHDDVLGAMVGSSDFDWNSSASRILPGAIVEHLTSFGATFQLAGQTKLTAFLRAGAAGASGTVTEPYALQDKFPTPFIHVYYVDGCSLAESFFQSVAGPYQLLIVGDACCRPFASYAEIEWPKDAPSDPWSGTVVLRPKARGADVDHFEGWLDGRCVAAATTGAALAIDTTRLADGAHEFHLVAVGPPPIGAASSITRVVRISHGSSTGPSTTISMATKPVECGGSLRLQGKATSDVVELWDGGRRLLTTKSRNGAWSVELPSALLGLGTVRLHAMARSSDGDAWSDSIEATIVASSVRTTTKAAGDPLPGVELDLGSGEKRRRRALLRWDDCWEPFRGDADNRQKPEKPEATPFSLRGRVEIPNGGLHEWSVGSARLTGFKLDGRACMAAPPGELAAPAVHAFAVDLIAGWHSFELAGDLDDVSGRFSLLGPNGPISLEGRSFGHGPEGLTRLPLDRLRPAQAAWADGNRIQPVAGKDDELAALELKGGGRLAAIALFLQPPDPTVKWEPLSNIVVETRDSGSWTPFGEGFRLGEFSDGGSATATVFALCTDRPRGVARIRVRRAGRQVGDRTAVERPSVCEVEAWVSNNAK